MKQTKARIPSSCKVYTPKPLATAIIGALHSPRSTWLEPSVGRGVFLQALRDAGVARSHITAVDLEKISAPNDKFARTTRGVDFLEWAYGTSQRFDRVVGNPPYIPVSQLPKAGRRIATEVTVPPDNRRVPMSANTWFAFVCASLAVLNEGGAIGFVLPASMEYAKYAQPLRTFLPQAFRNVYVYRSQKPLFESVQEGSVTLLAKGYRRGAGTSHRIVCQNLERMVDTITSDDTPSRNPLMRSTSALPKHIRLERLSEHVTVGLGGVTGDAKFFLMSESRRLDLGLPKRSVRPVLSKAKHLTNALVTPQVWECLRDQDERVWLFHPTEGSKQHKAVLAYLRRKPERGGCQRDRYKIALRAPWYRTILPNVVDGFISGMGRTGPWIALRRMPALTATNTLYVVNFKSQLSESQKCALSLSLLTSSVRADLRERCRVYADGLEKFEPGDIAELRVPIPTRTRGAISTYRSAVEYLLNGDRDTASDVADRFILE